MAKVRGVHGKLVALVAPIRCWFLPCVYNCEYFRLGAWFTCCRYCGGIYLGRNPEITSRKEGEGL